MTGGSTCRAIGSHREEDEAMARMTLEQIRTSRPATDRRKIKATTEEDIARQMVEDGEIAPVPSPASKQRKR
jgi:hypothetical protein